MATKDRLLEAYKTAIEGASGPDVMIVSGRFIRAAEKKSGAAPTINDDELDAMFYISKDGHRERYWS